MQNAVKHTIFSRNTFFVTPFMTNEVPRSPITIATARKPLARPMGLTECRLQSRGK